MVSLKMMLEGSGNLPPISTGTKQSRRALELNSKDLGKNAGSTTS